MLIKKVKLENFQKHDKLEVNFSKGVNVLWGETNSGKSCVIRAMQWVLFNEPKGDAVRKNKVKEKTIVEVELDNGVTIIREKSSSINSYTIRKDGQEKRFDSIGKVIPEEIISITNMFPMMIEKENIILNVAPQISLPFMMKESGTFRMKIFNKLTGNDVLDTVIQSFNKEKLKTGRDIKFNEN